MFPNLAALQLDTDVHSTIKAEKKAQAEAVKAEKKAQAAAVKAAKALQKQMDKAAEQAEKEANKAWWDGLSQEEKRAHQARQKLIRDGIPFDAGDEHFSIGGVVDYQAFLQHHGFVVVPTLLVNDEERRKNQAEFFKMFRESPEFRNPAPEDPAWRPVLGGFAALGNPSSFHHPYARKMREMILYEALIKDVLPTNGRRVEKVFDRVTLRRRGEKPTAESLHRDEAKTAKDGDDVFGGWLNIDEHSQNFRCCPRTHHEAGGQNKGFAKIKAAADKKKYSQLIRQVSIPKGHMLVFYERLVHEVANTKADHDMIRVHCGFRVTDHTTPLFGKGMTERWYETQDVPRIKSAQWPKVYPGCYPNFPYHWKELEEWSVRTFVDECLYTHTINSENPKVMEAWKDKGFQSRRVKGHMRSLHAYGFRPAEEGGKMHRRYREQERLVLEPMQHWTKLRTGRRRQHDGKEERVDIQLPHKSQFDHNKAAATASGQPYRRPRPWISGMMNKAAADFPDVPHTEGSDNEVDPSVATKMDQDEKIEFGDLSDGEQEDSDAPCDDDDQNVTEHMLFGSEDDQE